MAFAARKRTYAYKGMLVTNRFTWANVDITYIFIASD